MTSSKRTFSDLDPDYTDVCEQQNKRQREIEQDAKQNISKQIQAIVKNEFQKEISNKEKELHQIDKRLNEARLMMDRLRACIVSTYYGQISQFGSSETSRVTGPPASIHPAVKKHLGKMPVGHISSVASCDVKSEVAVAEIASNIKTEIIEQDLPSTSLWSNATDQAPSVVDVPHQPPAEKVPRASSTEAYDDRRARFKMKKKIIIGNVSKYIPVDHREANDKSSHKWMVYVRGPKADPDISGQVKKVLFFLHHSYKPNDLVVVSSPPFHLTRRGWGEFPVRVQLHFVDPRNKKVDIIHQLKLDKTFSGLQTLGAETVVELELEKEGLVGSNSSESIKSAAGCAQPLPPAWSGHHSPHKSSSLASGTVAEVRERADLTERTDLLALQVSSRTDGRPHENKVSDSSDEVPAGLSTNPKATRILTSEGRLDPLPGDDPEVDTEVEIAGSAGEYNLTIAHETKESPSFVQCADNLRSSKADEAGVRQVSSEVFLPQTGLHNVSMPRSSISDTCQVTKVPVTLGLNSAHVIQSAVSSRSVASSPLHNHVALSMITTATASSSLLNPVTHSGISLITGLMPAAQNHGIHSGISLTAPSSPSIHNLKKNPGVSTSSSSSSTQNLLKHLTVSTASPASSQSLRTQAAISATVSLLSATQTNLRHPAVPTSSSSTYIRLPSSQTRLGIPQVKASPVLITTGFTPQPVTAAVSPSPVTKISHLPGSLVMLPVTRVLHPQSAVKADKPKVILVRPTTPVVPSSISIASPVRSLLPPRPNTPKQVSLLTGRLINPQISQATTIKPSAVQISNNAANFTTMKETTINKNIHIKNSSSPSFSPLGQAYLLEASRSASTNTPARDVNSTQIASANVLGQEILLAVKQAASQGCANDQAKVPQVDSLSVITALGQSEGMRCIMLPVPGSNDEALKTYPKMSAIGITKHGKKNLTSSSKLSVGHITNDEDRKRNQYQLLMAWKNGQVGIEKVAGARPRDTLAGEAAAVPELNIKDFSTMDALLKAALKLHPLIQAGVNRLTHPYCAESQEQWNSWPLGKQLASERHRACFVLKYLQSLLGSTSSFHGETLMTRVQLVRWCRLRAFSPFRPVEKAKFWNSEAISLPPTEFSPLNDALDDVSISLTPAESLDSRLLPMEPALSLEADSECLDVTDTDCPVTEKGLNKVQLKVPDKEPDPSQMEYLPASDGAYFVTDQLRKKGIKLKPIELVTGVLSCTTADMLFQAMQGFVADVLRETLAVCSSSSRQSSLTQATSREVHKALTRLPEASFTCSKFLGKTDLASSAYER